MSNPTGDALRAEGLKDDAGSMRPVDDAANTEKSVSSLKRMIAKLEMTLGVSFKRRPNSTMRKAS